MAYNNGSGAGSSDDDYGDSILSLPPSFTRLLSRSRDDDYGDSILSLPPSFTRLLSRSRAYPTPPRGVEFPTYTYDKGICVIINIMNIENRPEMEREGSDKDRDALADVFKELNFAITIWNDLKKATILSKLRSMARSIDLDGPMRNLFLVVCMLSHGNEEGIECYDGGIIQEDELRDIFDAKHCSVLKGQPKLLIIQSCRGGGYQEVHSMQVDSASQTTATDKKTKETIPTHADFLIARSTLQGYVSMRNSSGSCFIQTLCEVIKKYGDTQDVLSILREVQRLVAAVDRNVKDVTRPVKQMAEHKSTLRKQLCFRKLRREDNYLSDQNL